MAIPRNTVNVSNNKINVVEVISFGPQGPQGPSGSGGGNIDNALTTASLAGYSLTFTKGNNSQFTLNLPQPTPIPTSQFIVSASNNRSNNVIDFERQDGTQFFVTLNNVQNSTSSSISVTANTASYVLASNIDTSATIGELTVTNLTASNINFSNNLTVSGNINATTVTADSFTGNLDWDNIINEPYFLDTEGDIKPHQIPIFIDNTTGLPENLPFSLPLGSEGGAPSVKGLNSFTFDGSTFNVVGNINASGSITAGDFNITTLSRDLAINANLTTNAFRANNFAEITGGLFLSSSLTAANLSYKIPQTSDDVLVYETGGGIKHVGQSNLPYTRFTSSATPSDAQLLMMTSSGGPVTREVTNSPLTYSPVFGLNISGVGSSFDIVANKIFIAEVTASSSTHTSLNVTGNEVDFTNLPTSDPGVSGRLFRTGSGAIGGSAGFQVVIVSQG